MELIQIIITSLKLFVLLAAIVILVSYFIFKVKDRKRPKPYTEGSSNEPVRQPQHIKVAPVENKQARFQVLNMAANFAADEVIFQKKNFKDQFFGNPINYKQIESNKTLDIYERYSNSNFEPMHKIKL